MALLVQCLFCTTYNGKLKYAKQCMQSLLETTDLKKNRLIVINQNSCKEATEWISGIVQENDGITVMHLKENIGTARGINLGLYQRKPDEIVIKLDDDLTWGKSGWVEDMEQEIANNPLIGILGLRRDDVYGEMIEDGNLLWCHDIMGTCTAYNPLMVDKVGGLSQFSNYGFDDSVYSVRSEVAGFKNAFMKNIKIVNLDEGGTKYTDWKKREAGIYIQEATIYMNMIKEGKLSYYYDEGFDND